MLERLPLRSRAPHEVQFYQHRRFLTGKLAEFVEKGFSAGERVLIITEEATAEMLWSELQQRGLDLEAARRSGRLVQRDACEVAARIAREGRIDPRGFETLFGSLVGDMFGERGSLRIYGEAVNVLLKAGNATAALELEALWNELLEGKPFTLLCGYDLSGFIDPKGLHDVTMCHNVVHPAEALADFDGVKDPHLLMGELQHCDHLLETEYRARRELEEERGHLARQAEILTSHLGTLQAVTASLSEPATPVDVVTELARVSRADQAFLALPFEDERRLALESHAGLSESVLDQFSDFPADALLPAATAFRTGQAVWLDSPAAIAESFPQVVMQGAESIACIPLLMGKKRIGVVGFGYSSPREFTPADRALFHDVCRQATLALERSRYLKRAEQAKAREELLAMLSHELRNRLSPIVASLELIRSRDDENAFAKELDAIESEARNLLRVLDGLLDI
jgi:GAF domain-containing protein